MEQMAFKRSEEPLRKGDLVTVHCRVKAFLVRNGGKERFRSSNSLRTGVGRNKGFQIYLKRCSTNGTEVMRGTVWNGVSKQ